MHLQYKTSHFVVLDESHWHLWTETSHLQSYSEDNTKDEQMLLSLQTQMTAKFDILHHWFSKWGPGTPMEEVFEAP